jgi:small subunit ribosomal protein S7
MDNSKNATETTSFENLLALGQLEAVSEGRHANDVLTQGHKFGLPSLPLPSNTHLKHRYDPVVEQVTKLLMRHGKLSVAQRVGSSVSSLILRHLRNLFLAQRMLIV